MEAREMNLKTADMTGISQLRKALIQKWGKLLEGIRDPYVKGTTAILLENQMQSLKRLDEATDSGDVGSYTKFIFPLLRRVWPNLIANEIVSVQPMSAPVGAVFKFEYKYGSAKGATATGTNMIANFDKRYTSEEVYHEDSGKNLAGDNEAFTGDNAPILVWKPIKPSSVYVYSYNSGNGVYTQIGHDDGAGSITGEQGVTFDGVHTINYTTGKVELDFAAGSAHPAGDLVFTYQYVMELNSQIPELIFDIGMTAVTALPRKLKALWSSEAADDLKAFHGLDAETEVISGISSEVAFEIDREIVQELEAAGLASGNQVTWDATPPAAIALVDYYTGIIAAISMVSNRIHKKTHRGPGNFLVTSPEVCAVLESTKVFRPIDKPKENVNVLSIEKIGILLDKWVVYRDPFFTVTQTNTTSTGNILVGYKGNTFLDAGYAYAPYIPLQITPTFLDPGDFSNRKGIRTRYAKQLLDNSYYGIVTVNDLPTGAFA